jgi:hypothetical protein
MFRCVPRCLTLLSTMRTLILCPACGADRLIPLTFRQHQPEAGPPAAYRYPIAKCCACGERIFAHLGAMSLLSITTEQERFGYQQQSS